MRDERKLACVSMKSTIIKFQHYISELTFHIRTVTSSEQEGTMTNVEIPTVAAVLNPSLS
jgi:hypothetical protein